ncbi:unnamed protein product [Leptosia nina]|uniref:ALMS motif domain-containing protein n=1 Tax=Leptosia nina TaxID=320188 RepID=A0AAV1J0M1_9NEOP
MDGDHTLDEQKNFDGPDDKTSAVNNLILEYYKKFGKKRDLEQFFSLSTAQNEIRDPTSSFWKRMKALSDSSDSGDKKSESSAELCRISIRCSMPEASTSHQKEETRKNTDSDSPPIITEVYEQESSDKSDVQSLKSADGTLDTSTNKHLSPTSSITSQRKLEWDSLADVGYGNESDKKTSASSLSTLERLALQQQYCNDSQQTSLGIPTAHSTPLEPTDTKNSMTKTKGKKDLLKRTTKILNKDTDYIEMSLPQIPEASQSINFNLTKHITLNVDKKGEVNLENVTKNISTAPNETQKVSVETDMTQQEKNDKEIQTTLMKGKANEYHMSLNLPKYPVSVNLNTLKKQNRKRKFRRFIRKSKFKKESKPSKENKLKDKSGEQISAAESFEYMPAHIYHQNQINDQHEVTEPSREGDNKSSLESSAGNTTDSRKGKNSFANDLEKCLDLLKMTLNKKHTDKELKKKLVKEIVQRLLKNRYKDDTDSTDFLSGLSFSSKKLDMGHTTTSTSDSNNTAEMNFLKPKKSILRTDKFNSKILPSTSQSTPNLPSVIKTEIKNVTKTHVSSNTDSDLAKDAKTSSEELYQKYLLALRREQAYKNHLRDKEALFKQKLVGSDNILNKQDVKAHNRIKDLMKDLVRNNYDDGSGDASKLEGCSNSHIDLNVQNPIRKHRSHSVFTLSSGTSDNQQKASLKKTEIGATHATCSKTNKHYCCCPFHTVNKLGVTDSAVQVNILCHEDKHPDQHPINPNQKRLCGKCSTLSPNTSKFVTDIKTNDIRYVCLCKETDDQVPDNILIYKCSRLDTGVSLKSNKTETSDCPNIIYKEKKDKENITMSKKPTPKGKLLKYEVSSTKSSQTNLNLSEILRQKGSNKSPASASTVQEIPSNVLDSIDKKLKKKATKLVHEAIRCTQTDITINPKIPDPTYSDIQIIDKKDCAKLISEHFKRVSDDNMKTSSDDLTDLKTDSSDNTLNKNVSPALCCSEEEKRIKPVIEASSSSNLGSQCNLLKERKYSIPIEGTNMTLKVSLGDTEVLSHTIPKTSLPVSSIDNVILASKNTSTEKPKSVDNSTSLIEECSVGVQSNDNNIFNDFYKQRTVKSSITQEVPKNNLDIINSARSNCEGRIIYNTYPKADKTNTLKPLLRSNTDTGKMERGSHVTFDELNNNKEHTAASSLKKKTISVATATHDISLVNLKKSSQSSKEPESSKSISDCESQTKSSSTNADSAKDDVAKDPLIDLIQGITKRYSKTDIERNKRKKCFKEIITVLNYLLDTEDSSDREPKSGSSTEDPEKVDKLKMKSTKSVPTKLYVDKAVQPSIEPKLNKHTESSGLPTSTEFTTSTDSTTCQVLNKIKKECDKYHQRRCKSHVSRKCEESSSTSMNCDQCRRVHHCYCKGSKCKKEKSRKKCVAYNLILQSDSLVSEETIYEKNDRPLRNIIVKVPKRKYENVPFREVSAKFERAMQHMPHCPKVHRSKSLPDDNDASSTEDMIRQTQAYSLKEYLERNRPDFVEKSSQRQSCLKMINETRAHERATKRELLSVQVGQRDALSALSQNELLTFAKQLGTQLRTRKLAPKFISERDMKRHSQKIYKSLPEVQRKKEEIKKESQKKTNLLLANIFKKNLQKKTLQGAVNLSNYSTIIKI